MPKVPVSPLDAVKILPWLILLVTLTWVMSGLWRMHMSAGNILLQQKKTEVLLRRLAKLEEGEKLTLDAVKVAPEDILSSLVGSSLSGSGHVDEEHEANPKVTGIDITASAAPKDSSTKVAAKAAQPEPTKAAKGKKGKANVGILLFRHNPTIPSGKVMNMDWLFKISYHNHLEYANRWGYDLIVEDETQVVKHDRDPRWSKVLLIQKWLPKYKWLMYMDVDTFFMRFDLDLEHLYRTPRGSQMADLLCVVLPEDWRGVNTGVMLLRNDAYTKSLLEDWWNVDQRYWTPGQEQTALMYLLQSPASKDLHKPRFRFPSCHAMAAYPFEFAEQEEDQTKFRQGDFISHMPQCYLRSTCRQTALGQYSVSVSENGLGSPPVSIPDIVHPQ